MFFPVLLVRDFGLWGWVVFAVPNVVGAAAMGAVLARRGASERVVAAHPAACACFSVVTILFHVLFLAWIVSALIGRGTAAALVAGAAVVFWAIGRVARVGDLVMAVLLWAASAGAFVALAGPEFHFAGAVALVPPGLWPLAAVCLFGFALCPYLDLTFHRARQATAPRTGVAAFAIGFGVLFLLMIVFSLWYAHLIVPGAPAPPPRAAWIIAGHMALQTGFTVAVHVRSLQALVRSDTSLSSEELEQRRGAVGVGLFVGCLLGALPMFAVGAIGRLAPNGVYRGLSAFEIGYRLFMSYYGLVFPAYAWICMLPRRRRRDGQALSPGKLLTFALASLVAAPMFWVGSIEKQYVWFWPGLAVLIAARFIAPAARRRDLVDAKPAPTPG
jgi:hypothetical protein